MPTSTYYASQGLAERTDLGGLNLSNVPKVFIETGNMRNATDTSLLEDADFRQRAAQQLAVWLARSVKVSSTWLGNDLPAGNPRRGRLSDGFMSSNAASPNFRLLR